VYMPYFYITLLWAYINFLLSIYCGEGHGKDQVYARGNKALQVCLISPLL
jgi:hypothetical protein